jgi:hypothetical protein
MTGLAMAFETVVDTLFRTFGPFVIPATVFVLGLIGYGVLFALSRWLDSYR